MPRRSIKAEIREFVLWAQEWGCLLCSYPLHLHLHHVIPVEEGGSDHYLNLLALCPNHHYLVEFLKREIVPRGKHEKESWIHSAEKAVRVQESLRPEDKNLLNVLVEPSRLSGFKMRDDLLHLAEHAARDVMRRDIDLLNFVNQKRPRIFLGTPSHLKNLRGGKTPYDESSIKDIDLRNEINRRATDLLPHVGNGVYGEVISAHMQFLGLPYRTVAAGRNE